MGNSEKKFKEKLLKQLANTKGKSYYSTLLSYVEFVKKNMDTPIDSRYLFNILRDAGYMYMLGIELDSEVIQDIKDCFTKSNLTETNMIPSAFMNFSYLDSVIKHYVQTAKNFPAPPLWTTNLEQEYLWEDSLEDLRENCLDLIMSGFDISAVLIGAEHFKEIINMANFNSLLLKFEAKSKLFLNKFNSENKKYFYHLSDDIAGLLEKFFHLPRNQYYQFLSDISKLHPDHEEHVYFREILPPQTAERIYNDIEENYDENSSVALTYFFKAALALEVLHKFIKNKCFAILSNNTYKFSQEERDMIYKKDWQLSSSLESGNQSDTPMLLIANKQYSLHISDSKIKFWGVRNDPKNHLALPLHNKDLNGALFCSWKQYANGALLVRFDSYINRDQFINIINNNQNEKFIKLNYNNIYQKIDGQDPRKAFLQQTARAVLGLQSQSETEPVKSPKTTIRVQAWERILINETNRFKQISDDLFSGTQCAADYDLALAAGGDDSDEDDDERCIEFKKTVEIDIANSEDWKGLFSSFSNAIRDDFKRLVDPENGTFCYAGIIVYKNHKIELINVADLPKEYEKTTIKKELSQNKDCLAIYLGITNKSNEKDFSKIIDEYKDALEKNKDLKSENLKIIRWIKFNFKFNQTE